MVLISHDVIDMLSSLLDPGQWTLEVLPTALERLPDLGQPGERVPPSLQIRHQGRPFFRHFVALGLDVLLVALVGLFGDLINALQEQVQFQLLVLKRRDES